jgi:hypothetical protein
VGDTNVSSKTTDSLCAPVEESPKNAYFFINIFLMEKQCSFRGLTPTA